MLKTFITYTRPYKWTFLGASLISATGYAVWLIIPWVMGEIITFAADYQSGDSVKPALNFLGLIAITALYYYGSVEIGRGVLRWVSEQMSLGVQKKVLHHLSLLDLRWHEEENSGSKLKKINRAGQSMKRLLNMYTDLGLDVLVSLIGIPVVFALLSWELNAILLLFFVLHYVLSTWLTARAMNQNRKVNAEEEKLNGIQYEMFNSILTIKSMGIQDNIMKWVEQQMEVVIDAIRKRIILFRTRMAVLGFERQIFRLLIIGIAVWKVIEGEFEVGMIAQVYFYFGKVEVTADRISSIAHQWSLTKVDMESLWKMMGQKAQIAQSGSLAFDENWEKLRVQDLSFNFETQEVLKGLSFEIKKGEKIGIVGISGAGKSTLMQLLLKLYDGYKGFLGFDHHHLAEIHRDGYIRKIGVVLQETELFNLSIKDNITMAAFEAAADEKRIEEALTIAQLMDFVGSQEKGWDTIIGEKGVKLSGGEKQRLGIARAIYRQPDILFLDEATSHLDTHAEAKIQKALDELFKDVTAIVIAHRLSTLKKMDRILVLQEGRIVQSGTFEVLSKIDGIFKGLWEGGGNDR